MQGLHSMRTRQYNAVRAVHLTVQPVVEAELAGRRVQYGTR